MPSSDRPSPGIVAPPGSFGRRAALALAPALCASLLTRRASAEAVQLPYNVQAGLLSKVAGFDRGFASRAGAQAVILLASMPGDAESNRSAVEMKNALASVPKVGELPHVEELVSFSNAAALAEVARSKRAAIVYFGPGFAKQVPAIREAFSGLNVLTVAAVPEYVPSGIVLGFDLISGRPKILIHIAQARRQQVAFPASVLNLMKVFS
jgi:YfiR/HmsC-like